MDNIKGIVNKVIGDIAERKPSTDDKLQDIWRNLLTKQELEHTKIAGTKEETLVVYVDSPAWLFQMKIKRARIAKQLKEEIPDIKHLSFKIGKVK